MSDTCPEEFVELAERLANIAAAVTRRYFRGVFAIEDKADETPVTTADREAEAAIRAILSREVPDHGILGEEFEAVRDDAEFAWVIDPIDGTKAFAEGIPVFTTLLALLQSGRPILGLIDQPILGERWVGAAGRPTTLNGSPVQTRAGGQLPKVAVHATTPEMFEGNDAARFERLASAARYRRFGTDCYAYGLLASGHVRLIAEAQMKIHDYLPVVAVVEQAGGVITDWRGAPLGLDNDGTVLAAADPGLHRAALDTLNG